MLIVRRSKLYYTVSGIITPIGGRPVHGTATYILDSHRCDDGDDDDDDRETRNLDRKYLCYGQVKLPYTMFRPK